MQFPKNNYSKNRKRRKAERMAVPDQKESDLQYRCEELLYKCSVLFIRIPDAIYGYLMKPSSPNAIKSLVGKYLSGINDLVILHKGKYIICELKRSEKEVLSVGQKTFQRMAGLEHCYKITNFNQFVEVMKKYGIVA